MIENIFEGVPLSLEAPRHQCLVYEGSPGRHLCGLATLIRHKLATNHRCLYLHSPAMVAGMRSYLLAAGTDVTEAIVTGSLLLSSSTDHLLAGRFDVDRMIDLLTQAVHQALNDGYDGLWVSGDMSREFGPEKDFSKLLEYEWRLEECLQGQPALSGICQYHADTLPAEVLRHGLVTHPSLYISESLSRLNPHYVDRDAFTPQTFDRSVLDETINDLYQEHDSH